MRKLKTMLLLALTTGALGAFAAPAAADSYEWLYEGNRINEPVSIPLEGKGKFLVNHSNYIHCDIEAEATLLPSGAGEITKFDFPTCNLENEMCAFDDFSNDVPWSMHINESAMPVIEDMTFGTVFKSPCPNPFSWGPVDMTGWYNEYELINNLYFSGVADWAPVYADLDVLSEGGLSITTAE